MYFKFYFYFFFDNIYDPSFNSVPSRIMSFSISQSGMATYVHIIYVQKTVYLKRDNRSPFLQLHSKDRIQIKFLLFSYFLFKWNLYVKHLTVK